MNLGTGTVTLPATRNLSVANSTYSLTVGGVIGGSGFGLNKTGPGNLILTGVNTFSGGISNNAGTLTIGGAGQLGGGTYLANITNNGTLAYNSSANQILAGVISGTGSLTNATGTLTLTGVNTYSGSTIVSGGTLVGVAGGSVSSAVALTPASGYAYLQVSNTASGGQWTCASLACNSGGSGDALQFTFAATPSTTTAPLNITGNLTFGATPTVVVNPAHLAAGTYPLLVVGGTAPSTVPMLSLSAYAGSTLAWGGSGNKTLFLTVAGSAVTDPILWTASGSGTWDIDNSGNPVWKDNSGTPQSTYYNQVPGSSGDSVIFSEKYITNNTTVTLNSIVSPASLVTSNWLNNYTINGTGGITGTGGVTKYGTASLTLSTTNSYTGSTVLKGGTLTLDFTPGTAPVANIIASASALTLGGATLQIKGSASTANTQTVNGVTLNAGNSVISAAPVSGSNFPTVTLGALPANAGPGATIEFIGPATTNSSSAVAATATITTTTAGTGSVGSMGYFGNGNNGAYATVGLYDWATTDTTAGGAGTSPYTIIGGSQVTGFYQRTGVTTAGNYDVNSSGANSLGNAGGAQTVRFNQPSALTITFSASTAQNIQGFLVTPACGANNETLAGGSGNGIEFVRSTSGGNSYGVLWQNNTNGYFNINCAIEGGRQAGQANGLVQAGPGTVAYLQPNNYELSSYLNGGYSLVIADSGFGVPANASTVYLNGGTVVGNANFTMDNSGVNLRPFVLGSTGGGLAATAGNTMIVDGLVSGASGTGPLTIGIPALSANGNVVGLLPGSGTGTANTTPVYATGTVVLTNANNYTGGTIIQSGTLNINGIYALGGANYGGLTLNGGTLQYAPAFAGNGSGDLTSIGTAGVTLASGGGTIDVNGNTVTYAGSIGNSGSGALTVKSATTGGILNLSVANTYTGGTTIGTNITLNVNNPSGSGTGSGNVLVNGGTLAGSGSLSSSVTATNGGTVLAGSLTFGANGVTLNNGGILEGFGTSSSGVTVTNNSGGIIAPGATTAGNSTIGSLTIGSLTLNAGCYNNFAFNSTPTNDTLAVSTVNGLVINGGIFNLYQAGGSTAWTIASGTNTYNLIQYSGSISGSGTTSGSLNGDWTTDSGANPHVANPQVGYTYHFGLNSGWLTVTITKAATLGSWAVDGSGNWSAAGNWSGGVPGANSGNAGDVATFASVTTTAARTVTLDTNETVGAIIMNQAQSFSITNAANTLTLDNKGAGATLTVTAGTANAIQTAISLNDNLTASISSGKSLTISGVVTNSSGTTKTLTMNGAGTLTLSGNNSYGPFAGAMGTTLNGGGILQVGNNNALGTGDVTNVVNSTLQAVTAVSLGNNIGIGSGVTSFVDNNGNALTLGGVLSGGGGVTVTNSGSGGILTLGGKNTYGSKTTINAGIVSIIADGASGGSAGNLGSVPASASTNLILNGGDLLGNGTFSLHANRVIGIGATSGATGGTGYLDAANGQTLTVNGVIASAGNTGANNLTVNSFATNPGKVVLGGANTLNGTATISAGTLALGNVSALSSASTVALGSSATAGTLDLAGYSPTLASLAIGSGATATNQVIGNSSTSANSTLTLGSGTTIFGGTIQDALGAGSKKVALVTGSGTVTLSGNSTYSGGTTVGSGGLKLTSNNGAGSGTITVNNANAVQMLNLGNGVVVTNPLSINGTYEFMNVPDSGATAIYAGPITMGGGQWRIEATGSGATLVLSNATASYATGLNFWNAGNIILAGNSSISDNGSMTLARSSSSVALSLKDNATLNITSFNMGAGSGYASPNLSVTLNGSSLLNAGSTTAFNLNNSTASTSVGTLTLNGGTLEVPGFAQASVGANQTSVINFNGGLLKATASNSSFVPTLTNLTAVVQAGGAIINDNGFAITIAQPLLHDSALGTTADGGLTKSGSGVTTLSNTNTYSGATTVNGGTLFVSGTLGTNTITINTNATLSGTGTLNGATTVSLGGTLQAGLGGTDTSKLTLSNSLTLAGNVVFNLNRTNAQNANTIAGLTTVNYGGKLTVTNVGNTLQTGDTFTLFAAGAYSGGFTNITLPTLGSGLFWSTAQLAVNGTISVAAVPVITMTPAATNLVYGNSVLLTANVSGTTPLTYQWFDNNTNLISGETNSTLTLTAPGVNSSGNYTIVVTNAFGTATNLVAVTVIPAPLGVTANDTNRIYGAADPAYTASFSGFVNGDTVAVVGGSASLTTVTLSSSPVGTYTITAAIGSLTATNYNFTSFTNGTLTINAASLGITANSSGKTYGQTVSFAGTEFTAIGLLGSDTVTGVTLTSAGATNSATVSSYPIIASTATGSGLTNYSISYTNGLLAVNPLAVVLAGTRPYDTTTNASAAMLSVANAVGSDDVIVASGNGGLAGAGIGTQTITSFGTLVLGGTTAGNYTLAGASGSVIISQASATVSVSSSASPAGYLDSLTFTANVAPTNATGSVTFYNVTTPFSTNTLAAGVATSDSLNSLPRGTNVITAVYAGDVNFLAATNTFNQLVTNHPPVAGNVAFTFATGVHSLRTSISNLLVNVTDADGDTISLVSLGTSTNGITPTITSGLLEYYNTSGLNDQFSYTITDGFGGTNTGYVSIVVSNSLTGPITGQFTSFTGGMANLEFFGIASYSYVAERSTNLTDWVDVSTNTAATNGVINVIDSFGDLGGIPPSSAYYRLKYQP